MKLYTIGFTNKSAAQFFGLLSKSGVRHLLDTRLSNKSQLAGFSKAGDLEYFLDVISGISYRHAVELAPTPEMLDRYKKLKGSWAAYEVEYLALLEERGVRSKLAASELTDACLLCSEHDPSHCHRRLAAEYIRNSFPQVEIIHLK